MTDQVSEADVRRLFPAIKKARAGCHEVSKGIVLEVIEEFVEGAFPHTGGIS
jgi:hypothetical protein